MTRKAPLVSWLLKENGLSKATTFFCTFREKLFAKKPRLVSRAHIPPRAEGGRASAEGEVRCSSIAMGRKRCSHGKLKDSCVDCKGCPHGKLKRNCADCTGCPHGKAEKQVRGLQPLPAWQAEKHCAACNPCPHGKVKGACADCTGCPHGKRRRNCADCNPCPHSKVKGDCVDCTGCPHGKLKDQLHRLPAWQAEALLRGLQPCPHGKVNATAWTASCPHGKRKRYCADCKPACPHGKR
jgi:hypothetical protein